MTHLELFKSTVEHRGNKEFLFYAEFTPEVDKKIREKYKLDKNVDLRDFFGIYHRNNIFPEAIQKQKPDFDVYFEDVEKPEGSFINELGVLEIPAKFYHFTGYISPLRNAKSFSDIQRFPYPSKEFEKVRIKEKIDNVHKEGRVASCFVGHMYEDSWQVRGYEEFLIDLFEQPQWCEYILDKFAEKNLELATFLAEAGADVIATGDDVASQKAMMFSPSVWRNFLKPRWAKIYSAARKIKPDIQIWYHSDGNITEIIPDLIEIGITILNPVQPECMSPIEVKKRFGKQLVLDGTIGTQTTMPFGTPEDIRKVVDEMKKTVGYDGALILAPTHILEPDVSVENIVAFVKACKEE
ncbi:hypothetical protein B9J78_03150 [bacterium Unc6]|nr:hypothetical protein [bacterium Unc6]